MENPFEIILDKLNRIETLIESLDFTVIDSIEMPKTKNVLNIKELAEFCGISQSCIYKKTSEKTIPHYKNGKRLFFKTEEIEKWMLSTKITTKQEIETIANKYIAKRRLKF